MLVCYNCNQKLNTNEELLLHTKVAHSTLTVYKCSEYDCRRSFSLYYSFWKHRTREHKLKSDNILADEQSQFNFSISEPTSETFHEKVDNLPENRNTYDDHIDSSKHSENYETTSSEDEWEKYENGGTFTDETTDLNFENNLNLIVTLLIAKWYSITDLPRSRVQMLISDIISLLSGQAVNILCNKVLSRLVFLADDPSIIAEIHEMFNKLKNPFAKFDTEHKRFKYFCDDGTLILPNKHIIGYYSDCRKSHGHQVIKQIPITAQYIPMQQVLTAFFNLPNVYTKVVEYVNFLYNCPTIMFNIIQGELWREKMKNFKDIFVLPILLFFDEFETNNPLGSHKGIQKCGALYFKIPCLPPEFQSKMSNIFLFGLFNAFDRENLESFRPAVEQLQILEAQGIQITVDKMQKNIFLKLIGMTGDNLGLNQMFGLVENFNATFFCRFCKTQRKEIDSIFNESQCELRNKENYEKDLLTNNVKLTGIVKSCKFKDVEDFHFLENVVVDAMHDLLEGVCQYDLGKILHYFICKENPFFSLSDFNSLVQGFDYNINDRNKPSQLTDNHLKKKLYAMSAAEMLNLCRNLPMIIGHLVPAECEHWRLIILLQQIIFCVTEKYCQFGCWDLLDSLI